MKNRLPKLRIGAAIALGLTAAACSNAPHPRSAAVPSQATDRGEIETIATMLDQGDARGAKKRLTAALKRDPGNPSLMLLRDSMTRDPKELLGPTSFPYTVQPGDTVATLAQRFLGNRLKSHQLARYNGLTGAAALAAGQVLQIPGQAPRAEPKRPERRAEPQAAPARPKASPPPRAVAAPASPAPSGGANAAAARQARSAGLAALNEGNPARAVGLLSRAASLDPGNAAIARDLARARRIAATVRARQ